MTSLLALVLNTQIIFHICLEDVLILPILGEEHHKSTQNDGNQSNVIFVPREVSLNWVLNDTGLLVNKTKESRQLVSFAEPQIIPLLLRKTFFVQGAINLMDGKSALKVSAFNPFKCQEIAKESPK